LNQAALDAGEHMEVDFRTLYGERGVPLKITVSVQRRSDEFAEVRVQRQRL
jgi:hypothetical protein